MHSTKIIQSLLLALAWWLVATMRVFAEPFQLQETTMAEIQQAFTSGELTAETLVSQYLDRIAAFDQQGPRLNAIISLNPAALDIARGLDQERAQTGPRGPLHGVPVLVKDNLDTFDMPTTAGSLALQGSQPPNDAFIVKRLRDAGAIILGKTNLHEGAAGFTTWSGLAGQTLNPYDPTRIPGGSSGGTASAVAANLAVGGLGTDTAGSIRYPAAMTNLVGIKPTFGLTSRDGLIPLTLTRDIAGPLARSVTDAAILLDVIAGPDPADPVTADAAQHVPATYTSFLNANGLAGARLGVFRQMIDRPNADVGVLALHDAAIARMRSLGAEIVELPAIPDLPMANPLQTTYQSAEYDLNRYLESLGGQAPYANLREMLASGLAPYMAGFEPFLRGDIVPESDPLFAQVEQLRAAVKAAVLGAMDSAAVDAIVYPTAVRAAPPISDPLLGLLEDDLGLNTDLAPLLGFPAITVPAGFTAEGLPTGVEFMGRAFSEGKLIELAYAFEQATLHRRAPTLIPEPTELQLIASAVLASIPGRRRRLTLSEFFACSSSKKPRRQGKLDRFFAAFESLVCKSGRDLLADRGFAPSQRVQSPLSHWEE